MLNEGRCFTFVWKLQNASYCIQKKGEEIRSPPFVVDAIEGTKWRLRLYPRGEEDEVNVEYYLHREEDCGGGDHVNIKYELTFIGINGTHLINNAIEEESFTKGTGYGEANISIKDMFKTKRSVFLPNDTLTFRCRIWKSEREMTEDVECTAITRIGVEKIVSKWDVKNFSSLELSKNLNHQIKSVWNYLSLMSVDLQLTEGLNSEDIMRFKLFLRDATIEFATLQLFLINSSGKKVECNQEEMWFDPLTNSKQFTFTYTKRRLIGRKNFYLPNDTLSLVWEWGFSNGFVSEEIDEDEHGCICSEVKISNAQNSSDNPKPPLNHFVDNVKCLYEERFLSDVKLKTATSEFPAHKFMLSVSSSVFKAMFSNDMKEKITDCVLIEDLDDDTVSRMLHFIYTTLVEDLTWESASNLYSAADKYAILCLKNTCSSYIKKNLSPNNACDVLLLADTHADAELKSEVQNYIIENGKRITKSDEWKVLMETNGKLAAETLCELFR